MALFKLLNRQVSLSKGIERGYERVLLAPYRAFQGLFKRLRLADNCYSLSDSVTAFPIIVAASPASGDSGDVVMEIASLVKETP
jgi:hypothetical protein